MKTTFICISTILLASSLFLASTPARALNKQGLSSPADAAEAQSQPAQNVSGYVFGGALAYNPSYAARPDGSGRALGRFGTHIDVDLLHKDLGLTYDGNVFTDRLSASEGRPSEIDHIVGVVTRRGDWELGGHVETDRPADRPGLSQTYVDVAARWSFDAFRAWRALGERLPSQGWTGFFSVAGFAYNPTYAARPDNSGLALLRIVAHSELAIWRPWLGASIDLNAFTDRTERSGLVPSELDTTVGVVGHLGSWDLAVIGENDRPVDRGGLQQSYVSMLVSVHFDARELAGAVRGPGVKMAAR